jgi:hypothetical protein
MEGDSDDGSATDAGAGGGASNEHAPRFLSLGTNTMSITEGGDVNFTAVVTDPDGIDDLIGGSLTSPDGTIQYGAFATASQEGAYSLSLSWRDMNEVESITFGTMEQRVFRAVFFDVAGNSAEQNLTIKLTCEGRAACDGDCASVCGFSTQQRVSCNDLCRAVDATCVPNGNHAAIYDYGSNSYASPISGCTTVPPAQSEPGGVFVAMQCACIPMD